ncbi:MAG: cation:proton antiporter [Syntrophus sp. RIFOXYC2_FULL_54_9]|nr:MAG: cation:proton antiporter [Syntrophus sp. GWC2_56_31]OHE27926.1 MAG: cation:proton antiporter [Syntrophus sp. RIFOXYC2_FULL_54_9]
MYWEIEIALFVFLIITAVLSLYIKDLLTAVVTLNAFSFISALIYIVMGAIDVGFTEAVVGAGVTGIFFVVLIFQTYRRSID